MQYQRATRGLLNPLHYVKVEGWHITLWIVTVRRTIRDGKRIDTRLFDKADGSFWFGIHVRVGKSRALAH